MHYDPAMKWLRVLLPIILLGLWLAPAAPARAGEERVERLSASFAVQADGTVDVRYELHWDFGEAGRRGIQFGIRTREP